MPAATAGMEIFRSRWFYLALGFLGLMVISGLRFPDAERASAAPEVSYGALNGSCYLNNFGSCSLRVDPFSIAVAGGSQLEAFKLQANGTTVYHFSTDVSNPPGGTYTPSLVKLDFAAVCSRTYVLTLIADDTSQAVFQTVGQTKSITCPHDGLTRNYLPTVLK